MSTNTESTSTGRIVVGVDGSEAGTEALRWAARLAPVLGATIDVVSAWEYLPTAATLPVPVPDWEQIARHTMLESVREVFGDVAPSGLVTSVVSGHPAQVLLDAARGATMVIVGSRGLGGFAGLVLGSVSRNVSEHASCPVLVVHAPGQRAG